MNHSELAGACRRLTTDMRGINPHDLTPADCDALRTLLIDLRGLLHAQSTNGTNGADPRLSQPATPEKPVTGTPPGRRR